LAGAKSDNGVSRRPPGTGAKLVGWGSVCSDRGRVDALHYYAPCHLTSVRLFSCSGRPYPCALSLQSSRSRARDLGHLALGRPRNSSPHADDSALRECDESRGTPYTERHSAH